MKTSPLGTLARWTPRWFALFAAVAITPGIGSAQGYDEALFDALQWRNVGPARGGRSIGVAGTAARPHEYYFGATGGGLWKTTDGGNSWNPVTDGKITTASVGAVAVCEADPDVVYIGGGETQIRGNIQQGDGVYKSEDGGGTWEHIGLRETQNVARIRIHPTDCGTVWVAGFGVHSAPNPERGIYKTTDGGQSWDLVLHRSDEAGGVDISVHPDNPDLVFAATWEAWRKSWGMSSGGPGSALYRSRDGGETWQDISRNPGLPQEGFVGKIGVAVSPVDQDRVYTIVEHKTEGGVYRSDDGGETWTYANDERRLRQRAFYYTRIYADPQEVDHVYVLNTGFYKSTDGGETFPRSFRVPHGDNHDLWIAGDDNQRMINSNDGGANVSVNGGQTWTAQDFMTAQFYRVTTTSHFPYHICGAQQDNSTACVPHKGWNHIAGRGAGSYLYSVGGGESGYIATDPEDPNIFYAGSYGGALSQYDHSNGASRPINIWPDNPMGYSSEDITERAQWTFPIVFDNLDPNTLYASTQKVWRTRNEGQSWTQISPDLTRAEPTTMGPSGGPITLDQTGVETFATVFAIAPSYHDGDVVWAGSDDGLVWVTRNARGDAPDWVNVTPPDAPDFVRINTIEASPTTPGKAYVSGIRYLVDNDRSPYVWKTDDYGQSWTKIIDGIPADDFVRAVREDPARPGLLYAASERTVYVSWDDGAHWQSLGLNLPTVQVSDLVVEENDLVIGTHGRSFWVLYNIQPIREMSPEVASADAHLFTPVAAYRGVDNGVEVFYNLAEDAESVTLEFVDSDGEVIASFTGEAEEEEEEDEGRRGGGGGGFFGGGPPRVAVDAGSHQFTWNMRHPGWTDFEGRIFWAASPLGPTALPGMYQVRMTVDGEALQTADFEIKVDPRLKGVTFAHLQERFNFAMQIREKVSEANQAVIDIRRIKGDVDDRLEQTDNGEIEAQGETVKTNLSQVEQEVYQVQNQSNQDPLNFPIKLNNKLAALLNHVEGEESRPTDQSYQVYESLSGLLQVELDRMIIILQSDLARLNELLRQEGLDPIEVENWSVSMHGVRIVAVGLAAWALGACGILDEGDPEELSVELASDSTQDVLVVTSSDFVLMDGDTTGGGGTVPPPQVVLISADTQSVSSPWSQGFDLREGGRFFVEVQSPDSLGATVTLTVRLDGSLLSSEQLSAASSSVHFAYVLQR